MNEWKFVDLRSDTVTLPTAEMRSAMTNASVGDDVMGEDPSINELQDFVAALCRRDDALFVPSGTMANQIAVRVYGGPGTEILVVDQSHVFFYEGGSAAGLSGVQLCPVRSSDGIFDIRHFDAGIRSADPHFPRTAAFWIENTHNRGGGKIVPFDLMRSLKELGVAKCIPVHMDGARLCNASVATGIPLHQWAGLCDSFSICFSKGLGAPVGSILVGDGGFIEKCRIARKALGGGMRQAGILAAGALFSIKNHFNRLAEDHRRAQILARALQDLPGITIEKKPETNIVMIDVLEGAQFSAQILVQKLREKKVALYDIGPQRLRAVTHLGVTDDQIEYTIHMFEQILSS